jgi:outer membrane lipoprotein SlyB
VTVRWLPRFVPVLSPAPLPMRLSTFFWLATGLAIAFAAINWLGLAGWLAAAVVAGSIAMHVAGNAIGTRMQETTDRDLARRGGGFESAEIPATPPTHLERRSRIGLLLPVSVTIGVLIGSSAGVIALRLLTSASLAGALLGGLSCGVLGGLFGFLMASFVDILRTSVREALEAERNGLEHPKQGR